MEVDSINSTTTIPTAQIILPNGTKKEMDISRTAMEVIKSCIDEDNENYEDFALVFHGRKLQLDQKLENIPLLKPNRPIHLIQQRKTNKVQKKEEIEKLLADCRRIYRNLIEEAYQEQIAIESYQMLMTYIVENHCKQYENAIKEYPELVFDQLGQDILRDWRLLIPYLMENDQFAFDHPQCLRIFKKALDTVSAKFAPNSPFVRFGMPNLFPGAAGPSNQRENRPIAGANNNNPHPVITQQQLSQALALALGVAPGAPPANNPPPPPPAQIAMPRPPERGNEMFQNAQQNFAAQLQQMHEFGFRNDEENIQALLLTNGDVQQALEIVIAMKESN